MAELPIGDDWKEGTENDLSIISNCYCINCEKNNGITTMLPTKVPYFREIIIMSFQCNDCYYKNSEINFGGEIQPYGEKIELHVTNQQDLNRQIIKSDSCTVYIPQCYDFEIPKTTQRGNITTIEGLLRQAATNLELLQPERLKLGDVDNFHRCLNVIKTLRQYACCYDEMNDDDDDEAANKEDDGNKGSISDNKKTNEFIPFILILDDPAGNSYIENPYAPSDDPELKTTKYNRTPMQDMSLGLQPAAASFESGTIDDTNPLHKNIVNAPPKVQTSISIDNNKIIDIIDRDGIKKENNNMSNNKEDNEDIGRKEVIMFATPCPHCYKTVETNMCVVDIPHFKEIIIMSLVCENCGYKSNEIKGGGGIPKYGTQITLRVSNNDDLAREILKSDTAGIAIPELDFELEEGGLDGVYTTIEGLLQKIHKRLQLANPFSTGDSATKQHRDNDGGSIFSQPSPNIARYREFLQKILDMSNGKLFPFTVIISDPLSNSFIGPVPKDAIALSLQAEQDGNNQCYDDYVDHGMDIKEYERSFEQNEILGLNDMKTENYQQPNDGKHNDDKSSEDQQQAQYYGTDTMEEVPDRIRRIDIRGPDHPHLVGKAPVDNDTTIMGPGSLNFAVPSIGQRGSKTDTSSSSTSTTTMANQPTTTTTGSSQIENNEDDVEKKMKRLLHDAEIHDDLFIMDEEYTGPKEGMVFKDGAQGIGYYKDIPLLDRWTKVIHQEQETQSKQ